MRFDFEDDYTVYRLNEICKRVTRKNKNLESTLPLTISAQYGLVDQITFFNKSVASSNLEGYYLLKNGEFAYNKSYSKDYPWGAIKRLDKYDQGCLSTLYICFDINKICNSDYLVHYFESPKWYKQVSDIAGEGARNHGLLNISVDDFFQTKHRFPSLDEQVKVCKLLNLIETRIQTQNKIIEELKIQKKYIIKSIFNNINADEMSLFDLSDVYQPQTISSNNLNPGGKYPVYGANGIIGYYTKYNHENEQICLTCRGASVGTLNFSSKFSWITGNSMVINTDDYNSLIDKEYLLYHLMIVDFNKYITGSGQPQITRDSLKKLKVFLPNLEVQNKIKNMCKSIDSHIRIESKILFEYNRQKQFLLSNLFI